jgi:dipeptidyl aminopeptidase/acylaminoacyl peptidase
MAFPLIFFVLLGADTPVATPDPASPAGIAFERYTTRDNLGRTITFYLSRPPKAAAGKLPVVLFVEGSGRQSLFKKHGDVIFGGLQNLLLSEVKGRARVLAVEKPGVKFLDAPSRPGSAEGASEEFLKEHTLSRWAEANAAALRAAWTLPGIDDSRTLAVGHSEGGIVVARVAAELPKVTHVASLAGGGPTQLFSLAESFGQGVFAEWTKIQKDPDSTKLWLGHPYRRWSSFCASSVAEELARSKAKVYLAQGTKDKNQPATGHDVLVAELRSKGRDVTAERLEGVDHSFGKPDDPPGPPAGMQALFGRVVDWFLKP